MKDLILKRDPDGKWYVRPYLGTNAVTGKPLRPYKCFPDAADEDEAKRAAEAWAAGIFKASELKVQRRLDELLPRFAAWLAETNAPVNTQKTYRSSARLLAPYFQGMDPDEVSSYDIELVYGSLMREGGRRGHPLSPNSVCRHHGFLASAYAWMLEKSICSRSPMPYVRKPSREKSLAFAFSDIEMGVMLDELVRIMADDSRDADHVLERNFATAAFTAAYAGVREGEACGLDRGDINGRTEHIIVSATAVDDAGSKRQCKTKGKKVRKIPISCDLQEVIMRHMRWQDGHLPHRAIAGRASSTPLFCDIQGHRLKPANLSRWFSRLCMELGLPPDSHFHTLRHTFASILLDRGVDLRTIAELLGHAREGFTLETYAHMMPGRDRAAVDAFAASVGDPKGRGS